MPFFFSFSNHSNTTAHLLNSTLSPVENLVQFVAVSAPSLVSSYRDVIGTPAPPQTVLTDAKSVAALSFKIFNLLPARKCINAMIRFVLE